MLLCKNMFLHCHFHLEKKKKKSPCALYTTRFTISAESSMQLLSLKRKILYFFPNNELFSFQRLNYQVSCRWDFCFYRGSVVEHLDGHTDIVHQKLYSDWLPWLDLEPHFFFKQSKNKYTVF